MLKEVPVLDMGALKSKEPQIPNKFIQDVGDACREWGFFQVINHGVAEEVISDMLVQQRAFFALPFVRKRAVVRTSANSRGYFDDELTKRTRDWKEGFDFGCVPHPGLPHDDPANRTQDGVNQWPSEPPGFREAMWRYLEAMQPLATLLLQCIAQSLSVPPEALLPSFEGGRSTSFLRLNFYPPCPDVARILGVNRHTDAGAITILHQNEEGLQVLKDGAWVGVQPLQGAFVINIGDLMQVWSNGLYRAPLHRVVCRPDTDRFSAPCFISPSYDTLICPLSDVAARTGGVQYRPFTWGQFRGRRFEGDYADLGEEVQICDFELK